MLFQQHKKVYIKIINNEIILQNTNKYKLKNNKTSL